MFSGHSLTVVKSADGFTEKKANIETMNRMMPTSQTGEERYAKGIGTWRRARHSGPMSACKRRSGKNYPTAYRDEASLSPALYWDQPNPARDQTAALQGGIAVTEVNSRCGEFTVVMPITEAETGA